MYVKQIQQGMHIQAPHILQYLMQGRKYNTTCIPVCSTSSSEMICEVLSLLSSASETGDGEGVGKETRL